MKLKLIQQYYIVNHKAMNNPVYNLRIPNRTPYAFVIQMIKKTKITKKI